jgi:hypothetical protein
VLHGYPVPGRSRFDDISTADMDFFR